MELQDYHTSYNKAIANWFKTRDRTIRYVEDTIEKLIEHRRNVNISRITGASVSIGGAALAIVGFGLAPVTFGASLGLGIGGIAIATAGGATAAGASIADVAIQRSNVKETQKQYDKDQEKLRLIADLANKIQTIIESTKQECPDIDDKTYGLLIAECFGQFIKYGANIGMKATDIAVMGALEVGALALRIGGAAAKGIAAVGIVANVLLIPLDIIEIVRCAVNVVKGNESEAVKKLKELVVQLKKQKKEIEEADKKE